MYQRLIFCLLLLFSSYLQASVSNFEMGDNVEFHEKLYGDQNIVGAEVLIQNDVDGELFAMGGSVEINGNIQGNTLIIAGNTNLRGTFHSDLTVYGGNVSFLPGCKVYGNIQVFAGNVEFMGECFGSSQFTVSNLRIAGKLHKASRIYAAKIIFGSTAEILGSLNYTSPVPPSILAGATFAKPPVASSIEGAEWAQGRVWSLFETSAKWLSFGMSYLFSLVLGVLLLRFFRKGLLLSIGSIESSFWKSLLWGILATLILPMIILLLFATLLGIPLAFTLLALCIITVASAKIIPILWFLKKWYYRKGARPTYTHANSFLPSKRSFAIGLLIFLILTKVPLMGSLFALVSMLVGFGAILKSNLAPKKQASGH